MVKKRAKVVKRVTLVGLVVNVVLSIAKLLAGVIGRSTAMIADALHSLSDFVTDIVVIAFVDIASKDSDSNHRYGHGKFETFATLLISLVLMGVALGILYSGGSSIYWVIKGRELAQPGMIAFWAAIISIILKELLYRYTIRAGRVVKSDALIANGWHHRSDAFSSFGTALGISGAIFLGESWRILDPIAGVVVSFMIFKVALEIMTPSVKELLESSLPKEVLEQVEGVLESHPDIRVYYKLRSRKIGTVYAIDVNIKLDRDLTFVRAHDVATEVEIELKSLFGEETQITIHTEPL